MAIGRLVSRELLPVLTAARARRPLLFEESSPSKSENADTAPARDPAH